MKTADHTNRTRRWYEGQAVVLAAACALAGFIPSPGAAEPHPNIVMILADDQGWGDLSANGNVNLKTPHIDSLARDGARLDRFYVSPVCSPTRAEMLTGRYHTRLGVTGTSAGDERLNPDEKTMGDIFKAAGYATGVFGKWHNGTQWPYHPNARGFTEFYGFSSGHWGHYFSPELEHNNRLVRGKGYVADDFTNHALAFIKQNRDTPFFCYLPFNTPHSPMQVPDRFWEKFDGVELEMRHRNPQREDVQHTRAALAMCENLDWNVGRLLGTLDTLGIADNTIVLYFSDNGPNGWRWNGGMKGRKGSTDEGGVRAPCFIRWPGKIRPGTRLPEIAGAIDLLPTLADLSGIPVTGPKRLDGISLKPLLFGTATDWPQRMYFNAWRGRVSVRTPTHRLDHQGGLFDMEADPGQTSDISKEHPAMVTELKQAAADWKKASKTPAKDRPFPVGHPGARVTYLPARDGLPQGNIKRSSRHPNCSYFSNWTSTADSITWEIEVLTPGIYEVQIYYTCKKAHLSPTLELRFAGRRVQGEITEAFDPPLVGEAENRVPRGESLVKDFRPVKLGALDLPAERGPLVLRATEIPGREAIDVRYVVLTRLAK